MKKFIHETEVYRILKEHNIDVVKHLAIKSKKKLTGQTTFIEGTKVVVKGIAENLWHKSDEGALHFETFSAALVEQIASQMEERLQKKYSWIETLICEKMAFAKKDGLPVELFLSIKKDSGCGYVVNMSLGGIYTEMWSKEVGVPLLMWPVKTTTPIEALQEFRQHLAGKIWLGGIRQNSGLIKEEAMLAFLEKLWSVATYLEKNKIEFIEVNPVAVSEDGKILPLDGVGQYCEIEGLDSKEWLPENVNASTILSPKKVAIAGVSKKKESFGNKIFTNLLKSKIAKENIKIIRPDGESMEGVECYMDISSLLQHPVDALILALPAPLITKTIMDLCVQDGGAQVVYIVAGGIGDGADHGSFGLQLRELLNSRRAKGMWTPAIIGPNSLGVVLSPLSLNTLFISQKKLPIVFGEAASSSNIGIISQSGAFFITRLSNESDLQIKYGMCVGNQLDLSISQMAKAMLSDSAIDVVGLYIEGFKDGEVLRLVELALEYLPIGKHLILYKAGRSADGMKAAAGHTGAMAGDYDLQKAVLTRAGICVVESFADFINMIKFAGAYPDQKKIYSVAVVTSAGYESVASADALGDKKLLFKLDNVTMDRLAASVAACGLEGLVSPANPIDVTPMADEKAYLAFIEDFAQTKVDLIVVGAVPLTDRLETLDLMVQNSKASEFARSIRAIVEKYNKKVVAIVDSGRLYDDYRQIFIRNGIPTFRSTQEFYSALTHLLDNKF
ncbi:MAG: hypothetical protein A2504_09385 [Bdellovibrionales bacterium RIFOXYD12_FULL_39_22]|nr:MAG: hypothetical protein A2385_17165 [Bdellovibrionales bacterium RIFOXYB1_FULL_39_21]OFZ41048.1 MAG: hypothetical protein A2485_00090 [Bdellovibrionales bacterium RIFOXYC12_FULL_39_17]OFZ50261.1 MAG: hypothetical protein A2404_07405 [Bdellovibrionales bacterium RIFOXYC1_FULL_39_130]OFZ75062.1 MAG: hypothetical protein A2560_16100 [Bdellovibrionales bacterium RIFOXYD1_FULL_39_84]OFZ92296.1 MAG: hypothetical protein A2504_09385 [Bdellovibrionales bacterium RIFOXYD12_FULL_39_22]HLE10900.1 ac